MSRCSFLFLCVMCALTSTEESHTQSTRSSGEKETFARSCVSTSKRYMPKRRVNTCKRRIRRKQHTLTISHVCVSYTPTKSCPLRRSATARYDPLCVKAIPTNHKTNINIIIIVVIDVTCLRVFGVFDVCNGLVDKRPDGNAELHERVERRQMRRGMSEKRTVSTIDGIYKRCRRLILSQRFRSQLKVNNIPRAKSDRR